MSFGMILLAIFLIVFGLSTFIPALAGPWVAVTAIISGILLLVGK